MSNPEEAFGISADTLAQWRRVLRQVAIHDDGVSFVHLQNRHAALWAAKQKMWEQERWRAPFYWAAFTLQGEYAGRVGVSRRPSLTQLLLAGTATLLVIAAAYAFAVRRRRRARQG